MTSKKDRKSTRLNSSHMSISYAVFCLKKKSNAIRDIIPNGCSIGVGHHERFDVVATLNYVAGCTRLFFFNDTATTEIYTLSLHDALPISMRGASQPTSSTSRRRPRRPSRL